MGDAGGGVAVPDRGRRAGWLGAWLLAHALCVGAAFAGPAAGGVAGEEEAARQEAIYHSRGESVPPGYVVDRSLLSYSAFLMPGFSRALADLGPSDRWLDIGAGQGLAILDYYTERYDAMNPRGRERRGRKARAVAVSIEDRRTPRWEETAARLDPGQIRYLAGRRLREYSRDELGRFRLVSDFTGGFSYSRDLSVFMEKVLDFLEVDGDFHTLLLDVRPEAASGRPPDPDTQYLTEIEHEDGSNAGVCNWLKRIGCAKVACEQDTRTARQVELYHVRKVCEAVAVPALEPRGFKAGTPPLRRFVLRKSSARQPAGPR
ncbi:MAG: hypothetical protein IT529_15710 [Burkholderiales bacterium]|nr:hypothetical protein [Burkholderiales bacterium]